MTTNQIQKKSRKPIKIQKRLKSLILHTHTHTFMDLVEDCKGIIQEMRFLQALEGPNGVEGTTRVCQTPLPQIEFFFE